MKYLRFLRIFAFFFTLCVSGNAFAAYNCPATKTYTSCVTDHYLSSITDNPLLSTNSCRQCGNNSHAPDGNNAGHCYCDAGYMNSSNIIGNSNATNSAIVTNGAACVIAACSVANQYMDSTNTCQSCGDNSHSAAGNSTGNCYCDAGYKNSSNIVGNGNATNSAIVTNGAACVLASCGVGQYMDSNNVCQSCGDNSSNVDGNNVATCTCNAGYTANGLPSGSTIVPGGTACIKKTCPDGQYVNGTSCDPCPPGSWCAGGVKTTCPIAYPNSVANSIAVTSCYSDSKSRPWTGGQNSCSLPSGCASRTCSSCSGSSCTYTVYSNATGTGDGAIRSGCSSNSSNCTQSVASVIPSPGHIISGNTCPVCKSGTKPNAAQTACECDPAQLQPGHVCPLPGGGGCPTGTKLAADGITCECDPAQLQPGHVCPPTGGGGDPICVDVTKPSGNGFSYVCDSTKITNLQVCPTNGICPPGTTMGDCGICDKTVCAPGQYGEPGDCHDCPVGGTAPIGATLATQCVKLCPQWPAANMPDGCSEVRNHQDSVNAIDENGYPNCTYDPVASLGYDPNPEDGNTTAPLCTLHRYTITYHENGGTGAPINARFTMMDLPVTLDTTTYTGHKFLGWYSLPDFTGAVQTTIPAVGFDYMDKSFYAKWSVSTDCTVPGGSGKMECELNPANGLYDICGICIPSNCEDGLYLNPETEQCDDCPAGKICKDDTVTDCPVGGTSPLGSDDYTDCVKTCPTWESEHPNWQTTPETQGCSEIRNHQVSVIADSPTTYPNCTYDPVASLGYDPNPEDGNTTAPLCTLHRYTITYHENGGTGAPINARFTMMDLPVLLTTSSTRVYSEFLGWYSLPDFTGAVQTTIPAVGFNYMDKSFYAKWTCSQNAYLENGTCSGCPVYGLSAGGDIAKTECKKDTPCTLTLEGQTLVGSKLCNFDLGTNDYTDCGNAVCVPTDGCIPGYHKPEDGCPICPPGHSCAGGEEPAVPCPAGTYCPEGTETPNNCPTSPLAIATSPEKSEDKAQCYINCPAGTLPTNCTTISNVNNTANYIPANNGYAQCNYHVTTTKPGYVAGSDGPAPVCMADQYTITYVSYGGNVNGGNSQGYDTTMVNPTLPLADVTRPLSNFEGWYTSPDFTGDKVTEISNTDMGNKTFYARWTCIEGRYMKGATATQCEDVMEGYFSPEGNSKRYKCPAGYATGTNRGTTITSCYLTEDVPTLDSDCDAGIRWTKPGGYTASPTQCDAENTCTYISQPTIVDKTYSVPNDGEITGKAGYYYPGDTVLPGPDICRDVTDGWYSPAHTAPRDECPVGYSGSEMPRAVDTDCYYNCPPKSVTNASSVTPLIPRVNWNGSVYPECKYNITCEDGYCLDGESCVIIPDGYICTGDGTGPKQCSPGTYPAINPVTGEQECKECDPGSYCPGNGGKFDCATVGDGSYTMSDRGNKTADRCYKDCESPDGGITVLTGRDYYNAPDTCSIESCSEPGKVPFGMVCVDESVECSAPNASYSLRYFNAATQSYGVCTIVECDAGYHILSNACVLNGRTCTVENGRGYQEWDERRNSWGECIVDTCNPGYTNDPSLTNERAKQCGQCKNKFGLLGEQAASGYITECEIASCMYQGEKYTLEGNECVPICDDGYSDETGTMHWNETTKKCVRECTVGYTAW